MPQGLFRINYSVGIFTRHLFVFSPILSCSYMYESTGQSHSNSTGVGEKDFKPFFSFVFISCGKVSKYQVAVIGCKLQ